MDNSLLKRHPELVCEWSDNNFPLSPEQITFGSNKIVWWKGKCGHEWQASVKSRSHGENCPICSGARVIEGINDLATLKPDLVQEWSEKNEVKPTEVSVGSHKKVLWKCSLGHKWEASVKSRTVNGTGCPYCSHNKVLEGFNDLATVFPQIAAEWSEKNYPLLPTMVTPFANRKVWWKCSEGHEWHTLISTRSGGSKCPYCSGILLLKGYNDLAARYPRIAKEWSDRNFPLTPDMINGKSRKNVWWKCRKCGYEWKSVVDSRIKGRSCPVCAERAVLSGYNDLATTDKYLLEEWDYEKNVEVAPENVSRSSMRTVWWKCACGHSWRAKIAERAIDGKRCVICEKEYLSVLPELLASMYARERKLKVLLHNDEAIGLPLEIYLPDVRLAIETADGVETEVQSLKKYLCKKNQISLFSIRLKANDSEETIALQVKRAFQSVHLYSPSDIEKDVKTLRTRFFEWRESKN